MENTPKKTRENYRIRGERIWALAKARYLAGQSARVVAEALGLTVYAMRKRMNREGWTRRAVAEAEEAGVPDPPPDRGWSPAALASEPVAAKAEDAPLEPKAAARAALEAATRLIREGKISAAAEAARVADVMARAAARLEGDGPGDDREPDEAAFEAVRRKVLGWDEADAARTPPWERSPHCGEEAAAGAPPPPCERSPSPQDGEETA